MEEKNLENQMENLQVQSENESNMASENIAIEPQTPQSTSEIQCEDLHDGFVIVSEDWGVLGNIDITLGAHVVPCLRTATTNWFQKEEFPAKMTKGVKRCHNKRCEFFQLDRQSTFDANCVRRSMLITSDKRVAEVDDKVIKMVTALDSAASELSQTKTGLGYKNDNKCHTLRDLMSQKCDKCRGGITVHGDDLTEFGNAFQRHLETSLEGGYRCCLILWQPKEARKPFTTAFDWSKLKLGRSQEVVLHLRKEYSQKDCALLWNTKKIEETFKAGLFPKHKTVCNALFLGQHAGFEFDSSKTYSYTEWINSAPNEAVTFPYVKLDNNVFLNEDLIKVDSRDRLRVEETFVNPLELNPNRDQKEILLEWLEDVREARNNAEEKGFNEPRFFTIANLSCCHLLDSTGYEIANEIVNKITDALRLTFDNENRIARYLNSFPYEKLVEQIDNTIMPAVCQLQNYVEQLIPAREMRPFCSTVLRTKDITMVVACQVVIQFGMRGVINLNAKSSYEKDWLQAIGLDSHEAFRDVETFAGFAACKNISVDFEVWGYVLKYHGPIVLQKKTISKIMRSK